MPDNTRAPANGQVTIKRTRPGWLRIDVQGPMAQSARAYSRTECEAMAIRLAEAVSPDIWQVYHLRHKRGVAQRGFIALLSTRPEA